MIHCDKKQRWSLCPCHGKWLKSTLKLLYHTKSAQIVQRSKTRYCTWCSLVYVSNTDKTQEANYFCNDGACKSISLTTLPMLTTATFYWHVDHEAHKMNWMTWHETHTFRILFSCTIKENINKKSYKSYKQHTLYIWKCICSSMNWNKGVSNNILQSHENDSWTHTVTGI